MSDAARGVGPEELAELIETDQRLRPRRRQRQSARHTRAARAAAAIAVVLLAAAAAAFIALTLARTAPEWWRSASSPDATENALNFENALANAIYERRPEASRFALAIKPGDANDWLRERFPAWFAENADAGEPFVWPDAISQPQLHFEAAPNGTPRLFIGVQLKQAGGRVLSVELVPELDDAGALWLRADGFKMGRLTLPKTVVLAQARRALTASPNGDLLQDPAVAQLWQALTGERPVLEDAVLALGDGRSLRLTRVSTDEGQLLLVVEGRHNDAR